MNRKVTKEVITEIVEKLQSLNRFIAVRSTFIVGYPGETKAQFKEVLSFLQKYKLPNVGFFAYSREDGTVAGRLENQIDEPVKLHLLRRPLPRREPHRRAGKPL